LRLSKILQARQPSCRSHTDSLSWQESRHSNAVIHDGTRAQTSHIWYDDINSQSPRKNFTSIGPQIWIATTSRTVQWMASVEHRINPGWKHFPWLKHTHRLYPRSVPITRALQGSCKEKNLNDQTSVYGWNWELPLLRPTYPLFLSIARVPCW
jgi:hypothetical protein